MSHTADISIELLSHASEGMYRIMQRVEETGHFTDEDVAEFVSHCSVWHSIAPETHCAQVVHKTLARIAGSALQQPTPSRGG